MFFPVLGSKESGRPFSSETMLRDQAWPHCGWSAGRAWKSASPRSRAETDSQESARFFILDKPGVNHGGDHRTSFHSLRTLLCSFGLSEADYYGMNKLSKE